jgi:chemotaxis protein methyltransferase CheR
MNDRNCISFLQWALPRMGHRWRGYRQVRRQVCRRIDARIKFLGLADADAYRQRLESDSAEWSVLHACLPVTISRFFRDRGVFHTLAETVLPALAQAAQECGAHSVRAWSAGCASGEEAYSLSMLWNFQMQAHYPGLAFSVLATDADAAVLERARAACYQASSLRELDAAWREKAFARENDRYCLQPALRACVNFEQQDLSSVMPPGPFDLILCRNLAFTYFDEALQRNIAALLVQRLVPGGCLVLGVHERLPDGVAGIRPWATNAGFYRKPA